MNLSPRLNLLKTLITEPHDNIWDGCCDHGLLGQSLLESFPTSTIHFVDINAEIIQTLTEKLARLKHKNWLCYATDISHISLEASQTHLIILAGIGGQLMQKIMEALLKNIQQEKRPKSIEFLLAPIHHQYQLRSFLITHNISVIREKLIQDNGRFYETLHLSLSGDKLISLTGDELWKNPSDVHRAYLKRLIDHYERLQRNNPNEAIQILKTYRQLASKIGLDQANITVE